MKLRIRIIALLLIGLLAVPSCTSQPSLIINVEMTCEQFELKSSELGNEFDIEPGDQIRAKMCSNPSTGFAWDYTIDNEEVMEFVSNEFIETTEEEMVGAPGIDIFHFKAIKQN